MEKTAKQRFFEWRRKLWLSDNPDFAFLGTIAFGLRTIFDDNFPALAGVNGVDLFVNLEMCSKLTDDEGIGLLAHEIMHIILYHPVRGKGREHLRYNIAGDLVINQEVLRCGLKLPPGVADIKKYNFPPNQNTEDYYHMLEGKVIELSLADLVEAVDSETGKKIGELMVKAAKEAKERGDKRGKSMSKEMLALAFPGVKSNQNWEKLAKHAIEAIKKDYTWSYPNRRCPELPAIRSLGTKTLFIAVDCSGSCWDEAIFKRFSAEIRAITEQMMVNLVVIYHDDRVVRIDRVYYGQSYELKPEGGGGTSHVPVFEWLRNNSSGFDPVLCLTDMETSYPDKSPINPVTWACIGNLKQAPFGNVVHLGRTE